MKATDIHGFLKNNIKLSQFTDASVKLVILKPVMIITAWKNPQEQDLLMCTIKWQHLSSKNKI